MITNFEKLNTIFNNFQTYLDVLNIKNHPVLCNYGGYFDPNEGYGAVRINQPLLKIEYPIKQVKNEIKEFVFLLLHYRLTNSILEIGLGTGATHKLWNLIFEDMVTTIDINNENLINFSRNCLDRRSTLIHANSHLSITVQKTKEKFNDKKFDVLFLNGDNSYEGVKIDFFIWKDIVRKGGIIVFNNIKSDRYGTKKFLSELESGMYSDIPVTIRRIIYSKESGIGYLMI